MSFARRMYATSRSSVLFMQYKKTNDQRYLEQALGYFRAVLAESPPGDQAIRAAAMNNIAVALGELYECTGDAALLAEAELVSRNAVAVTPDGHRVLAEHLNTLSVVLQLAAERAGGGTEINEAVRAARAAVAATPAAEYARQDRLVRLGLNAGIAGRLTNLGLALRMLYDHTGDTEYLAEAVEASRRAVGLLPSGHMDNPGITANLSNSMQGLYERTGDLEVLKEAVKLKRAAVGSAGERYRAGCLSGLAGAVAALAEETGDMSAWREAVELSRAAAGDPVAGPEYVANLGHVLLRFAVRTGDADALTESVLTGRKAVAAAPAGAPGLAALLTYLGIALLTHFDRTGDAAELAEARRCLIRAAEDPSADVLTRITAVGQAVRTRPGGTEAQRVLAAVEAVVALLPQVTHRSLSRRDREHQVGQLTSVPEAAAAAALDAGDAERAVELLEQTRGLLVADTIAARSSDLARLRGAAPELAERFERLRERRAALDRRAAPDEALALAAMPLTGIMRDSARAARRLGRERRAAQAEWTELVDQIRALDGFAGFLAVPAFAELAAHACDGPVILVYAGLTRSDALIVTGEPDTSAAHSVKASVRVVSLGVTLDEIARQADRFMSIQRAVIDPGTTPEAQPSAQRELLAMLGWLWDTIAGPVLDELGYPAAEGGTPPRVWWCPVGMLACFPLHAAGHSAGRAAGHPSPPRYPPSALDRVVSSYTPTIRGLGYARSRQPAAGGTAMVVAVSDAAGTVPLHGVTAEAAMLAELLPGALLLRNPALHITGAFHLAGYSQVIGTLWAIPDPFARRFSADFYRRIIPAGTAWPDVGRAAYALREAAIQLRGRFPARPTLWAVHTHTGS